MSFSWIASSAAAWKKSDSLTRTSRRPSSRSWNSSCSSPPLEPRPAQGLLRARGGGPRLQEVLLDLRERALLLCGEADLVAGQADLVALDDEGPLRL